MTGHTVNAPGYEYKRKRIGQKFEEGQSGKGENAVCRETWVYRGG